jgi:hypothetical protein
MGEAKTSEARSDDDGSNVILRFMYCPACNANVMRWFICVSAGPNVKYIACSSCGTMKVLPSTLDMWNKAARANNTREEKAMPDEKKTEAVSILFKVIGDGARYIIASSFDEAVEKYWSKLEEDYDDKARDEAEFAIKAIEVVTAEIIT